MPDSNQHPESGEAGASTPSASSLAGRSAATRVSSPELIEVIREAIEYGQYCDVVHRHPEALAALDNLLEQLEAVRSAAQVVVDEFNNDNPFFGYSIEALGFALHPETYNSNPASSRVGAGSEIPSGEWKVDVDPPRSETADNPAMRPSDG